MNMTTTPLAPLTESSVCRRPSVPGRSKAAACQPSWPGGVARLTMASSLVESEGAVSEWQCTEFARRRLCDARHPPLRPRCLSLCGRADVVARRSVRQFFLGHGAFDETH